MPTLTLSLPEELKSEMKSMPELNWSEVAREAISKKVAEYKLFKKLISKSKLTAEDAKALADKVSEGMTKSLKAKGLL